MTTKLEVYVDEDSGRQISTQSMLKTFRRCPKQTEYKYIQRLKPKRPGKPLTQGDWLHKLFEAHYSGKDWREVHKILTQRFGQLMDEERESLGDLPRECLRIMRGYLWHYKNDPWRILAVEETLEGDLPDSSLFRVKIDLIVEDQFGVWIVDHKFFAKSPDWNFRLLDLQSAVYVHVARQMGIPAVGFQWNWVKRKAPTIPTLLKDGSRLSRKAIDTDYPTLLSAIQRHELDTADYAGWLEQLRKRRFVHGAMQTSPFYRRIVMDRPEDTVDQQMREAYHTSKRMHSYPWHRPEYVERVPSRNCTFDCSYTDICSLELMGGDTRTIRKQRYEQVDPLYYYNDDPRDYAAKGQD